MSKTNREIYDNYEDAIWNKIVFDEQSKGFVVVHCEHGKHELVINLPIALKLATWGFRVVLLAEKKTVQSADATINDDIWEFKTTKASKSSVQNRLREGKEQSENILLNVQKGFDRVELLRGILSAISVDRHRKIQKVGLLFESREEAGFIVLTREDIVKMRFSEIDVHFQDRDG